MGTSKQHLTIEGQEDGSHIVTLPDHNGEIVSWHVPARVSLPEIEAMLERTLGGLLGPSRTAVLNGSIN